MPIHLISGDDEAASNRAIEDLINKIIDPMWSSVNLSRLNASDISQAKKALEESLTPPLGMGGRCILLKNSPFCNGCSNELTKHFEKTLNLIPENTHLILNNKNKPDGRLKITKTLQKITKGKHFKLPAVWDEAGQKELVEQTAKALNLKIEPEAISLLVEAIGNDSARLSSELEKLALLDNKKTNTESKQPLISAQIVKALIGGMATNALQVGDSLLANDLGQALVRLDALIKNGEPALRILATLNGQIRGWLWVSLLEEQGVKDIEVIAKAAGITNPKRIFIMRKQIQGKPATKFLRLLSCLLDIEAAIKKGSMPGDAFRDGLLKDRSFLNAS